MGSVFVYIQELNSKQFKKQYFLKHIVNVGGILHKHMQKEYLFSHQSLQWHINHSVKRPLATALRDRRVSLYMYSTLWHAGMWKTTLEASSILSWFRCITCWGCIECCFWFKNMREQISSKFCMEYSKWQKNKCLLCKVDRCILDLVLLLDTQPFILLMLEKGFEPTPFQWSLPSKGPAFNRFLLATSCDLSK